MNGLKKVELQKNKYQFCLSVNVEVQRVKHAFIEYIGDKDSLNGYQRSNRLVLLKTFFALIDQTGKVKVRDVVNGYKCFYKNRKGKGLITDVGADICIENIEDSIQSQILAVIKRHPYRVLNEKGFLDMLLIDNEEYFVLNTQLFTSLSESGISEIKLLLEQKLDYYYSKIDGIRKKSFIVQENYDNSEMEIDTLFFESRFSTFREYCKESNISFTSDIEPVDFVAFRSRTGAVHDFLKEIKDRVMQVSKREDKPWNLKIENFNLDIAIEDTDKSMINEVSIDELKVHKDYNLVLGEKENCDINMPIANIFFEGIFKNFNEFCSKNNIIYIKELEALDFNKLLDIRGFGITRVNKIIKKYKEIIYKKDMVDETKKTSKFIVSDKMRDRIEVLLELNKNIVVNNEFVGEELSALDKLIFGVKELGIEICQMAYLYPHSTSVIVNTLENFSNNIILRETRLEQLNCTFKEIAESNKYIKVYPLLIAYSKDDVKNRKIMNLFGNCTTIAELARHFNNISEDYTSYVEITEFMEWLKADLKESVLSSYLEILNKDRYKEIIRCRANCGTLEAAGHLIGVTRERSRQIEMKIQKRFDFHNSKSRFLLIISAFINGKTVISEQELINYLGENGIEFVYLLKNSSSTYYNYSNELNIFIIGGQVDISKLKEFVGSLPDIVLSINSSNVLENIVEKFNISIELAQKAVESEYKLSGQVYHRRRISLTDMYKMILEIYYPTGVKLFEDTEQERFRRYIVEVFGDVKLPSNSRALDARVADIGVLCDRGTYIYSGYIRIDNDLREEIRAYIENGDRLSYTFLELYEYFKPRLLLKTNINNRYFLQGVLKFYYKNDFYFTKDMISKSSEVERIDDQIVEFVSRYDIVTKNQLRTEFNGVTEAMLFFAVSRCKEIICVENGEYMHERHLNIIESDYGISKVVDNLISEMPVSSRKLLEVMFTTHADFLNRNLVFSHIKLLSILQHMFGDKYRFSRPFIAKQDAEDITNIGVVRNYLSGRESYEISELIEFCEENHLRFLSWTTLVYNLSNEFIRADADICFNIKQLDIDKEKIDTIKNILIDTIFQKGYVSIRKIKDYMLFPKVGIEWNGYALESIVEKYIPEIIVLQIPTSDTFLLSSVLLCDNCNFDSYEEFLRAVIKSEHASASFRDVNEVKQWLQDEEIINHNIPKFMFDKSYLFVDEFGKIIVE